jgi:hypothetical protein
VTSELNNSELVNTRAHERAGNTCIRRNFVNRLCLLGLVYCEATGLDIFGDSPDFCQIFLSENLSYDEVLGARSLRSELLIAEADQTKGFHKEKAFNLSSKLFITPLELLHQTRAD